MKLFLDSSAFAKRFVEEPGSLEVETLCSQATELGLENKACGVTVENRQHGIHRVISGEPLRRVISIQVPPSP
jgi:hypothetical protein